MAWAHPTTGIVPHCAPSLALFIFQQIAGSRQLLERGYAIAATDYPGLGTPGPHPYLVGASEARAVIDSVRAARSFPGMANSNRYAVWGHSQGGQASLFTGMISKSYAPELRLIGVAAAAPATDLATLMTDDRNTSGGRNLTAMTVWSWARVYGAPIDSVVAPEAMPTVDRLANECIESIFDIVMRDRTSRPLAQEFLTVADPATLQPWRSLLARNTPGTLPRTIPVFLAQGSTDAPGTAAGHAELYAAAVPRRKPGEDAGDAERRSRLRRSRQRGRGRRLDRRPLRRCVRPRAIVAASHRSGIRRFRVRNA